MDGNCSVNKLMSLYVLSTESFETTRTALHWASHRGHEAVVKILLSNGADPILKTNKGQTALDLAEKYPGITELLSRVAQKSEAGPEPELPIVPTYMKEPDLEKSWLLPDEFAEAKVEKSKYLRLGTLRKKEG